MAAFPLSSSLALPTLTPAAFPRLPARIFGRAWPCCYRRRRTRATRRTPMPSISMVRKPPGKPGAMHSALPVTAGGTFWPSTHRLFGGFFGPDMRSNSRINAAHECLTKNAAASSTSNLSHILRQRRGAGIQRPARWQMAPWRSLQHAPRACPLPRGRCCAMACMLPLPACYAALPPPRRVPPMGFIHRGERPYIDHVIKTTQPSVTPPA